LQIDLDEKYQQLVKKIKKKENLRTNLDKRSNKKENATGTGK
jgi:hypothetical protein